MAPSCRHPQAPVSYTHLDVYKRQVMGRNDTKAIAMSVLDHALTLSIDSPTSDMEFVLLHGDCLEMNGFISHLKLPHYVTFQSKLDSLRMRKRSLEHDAKQ